MRTKPLATLMGAFFLLFTPNSLFAAPSLAEVGDLGKIADSQGIVSVRPKMAQRWSAATRDLALKPGDWLRTDVRGANALAFRLEGGGQVILGPGTLVEVLDAKTISFTRGEIEVAALKDGGITVQPAEGRGFTVRGGERKVMRRPDGRGVIVLEKDPNWLLGFKGAITSESMGSLLAKVDGRNTPLTLGYHKVNVDIRDGIARTVIEESFVNHTDARLEGTFYFPLPQDSSISGFGMWIGGELVEADVVEKQRAREIYETILRERRDPGLLEWTGGNLFKARVFPIEANSEKRIKITYTQVLPMRQGKLRYSYGLQSEMLQQNPLRELSINVRVSSALPIRSFTCATHDARISSTTHAAQAEFVAQEYTPKRDFEIEIDVNAAASPVVMIPHQRGEDGYFLALVTPPGGDGSWQRELVPDSEPIKLIILADTSGSMNASARANQDTLIASLLGSLGDDDSCILATCDTEVRWCKDKGAEEAPEQFSERVRNFVAARNSLGWTDLDLAFEEALKLVEEENTHVLYIGDGVISTGDADPVAFANRLKRSYGERKGSATFHAIAPGSSYESGVLKAIASLGGGSVRKISGSDTPGVVARNLLSGIARPGMRDLQIEFKGLRVARVYPEELPNLPAGSQQVIIGRYLPGGVDQAGEIVVTGVLEGREVRYTAPITLKGAEKGNSFIPRLWARKHLDVLLEQGRTQKIKDEIIALSEEYKIMTPYTSFLVLESDADRERFKVKKRFQMRDGERFFADGREQANYELLQQQMRVAGTWRLNLRRGILQELGKLGRGPVAQPVPGGRNNFGLGWKGAHQISATTISGASTYASRASVAMESESLSRDYFSGPVARPTSSFVDAELEEAPADDLSDWSNLSGEDLDYDFAEKKMNFAGEGRRAGGFRQSNWDLAPAPSTMPVLNEPMDMPMLAMRREDRIAYDVAGGASLRGNRGQSGRGAWYWPHYMGDLVSLFPAPIANGTQLPNREAKPHPWPAEALALADSLLRLEDIGALRNGGIALSQTSENYDVKDGALTLRASKEALVSGRAWWVASNGDRSAGDVQWWQDGKRRGHYFEALGLGRERSADREQDRFGFPLGLADHSVTSLADQMRGMDAAIEKRDGDRVELVLTNRADRKISQSYTIDTTRNVVLMITHRNDAKVTGAVEFSDFVEVGGSWWARSVDYKNADGKTHKRVRRDLALRNQEFFRASFKKALLPQREIVFIHDNLPSVDDAKQAAADDETSIRE